MFAHAGEEIRRGQGCGGFRLDRLQAGERLARAGDFHALTLLDPPGHSGEGIAEVTDRCRFHSETNLYHALGDVKPRDDLPMCVSRSVNAGIESLLS